MTFRAKGYVLFVDDDPDQRKMHKEMLETLGYKVKVAEDAHSALTSYLSKEPDIMLIDIMMPAKDGFALMSEVLGAQVVNRTIFIAISATERPARYYYAAGFDYFIHKPVSMASMDKVMKRAMEDVKQSTRRFPKLWTSDDESGEES